MSNTITIELCAEDRARLDKLTAALEKAADRPPFFGVDLAKQTEGENYCRDDVEATQQLADKLEKPAEAAETTTEATEAAAPPVTQPEEEAPAEAQESAPAEPVKPTVTLAQIQQKVVQLAAGFGGTKKAAVREIVNAYAKKVSDLPEDKWTEVWDKLTALESEG